MAKRASKPKTNKQIMADARRRAARRSPRRLSEAARAAIRAELLDDPQKAATADATLEYLNRDAPTSNANECQAAVRDAVANVEAVNRLLRNRYPGRDPSDPATLTTFCNEHGLDRGDLAA